MDPWGNKARESLPKVAFLAPWGSGGLRHASHPGCPTSHDTEEEMGIALDRRQGVGEISSQPPLVPATFPHKCPQTGLPSGLAKAGKEAAFEMEEEEDSSPELGARNAPAPGLGQLSGV